MVRWDFNAEKPGTFPQEKTDTSYPRASLGSCLGNCCSHGFNRAGLWLCWCCSLPRPLTGQKSPHRAKFGFSPQNEFTPPPKGGGAGYHLGWVCWGFHAEKPGTFPQEKTDTSYPRASLGSCLGNCWPQPAHTAPTGFVWGFGGVVPLPGVQNRTQGHTGVSLVLAYWLALLMRITLPSGNPV